MQDWYIKSVLSHTYIIELLRTEYTTHLFNATLTVFSYVYNRTTIQPCSAIKFIVGTSPPIRASIVVYRQ